MNRDIIAVTKYKFDVYGKKGIRSGRDSAVVGIVGESKSLDFLKMLIFWSLVRNSVVLAVYLLFSVACFFTVHEHSLCACSIKNESNNSENYEYTDVIYSLYYYFKQDTNDILRILSSDNLNEQASELKEKVNEVNWVVSALLTSLETLQDDTIITDSNEEDAKENITGITSLIDENLSDLYDDENSSALVDQFNKTLLANIKYVIELRFQILDIIILDNMPSQNLLGLDDLKAEYACEVKEYITINR